MKNSTSELAFMGEVKPAECDCHKGKFFCVAFLIHPTEGRVYLGNAVFDTESKAEKELNKFVSFVAAEVLEEMGLKPENAVKIDKTHGDDALKSEREFRARNNPNLH